jgi:hypothetical protein
VSARIAAQDDSLENVTSFDPTTGDYFWPAPEFINALPGLVLSDATFSIGWAESMTVPPQLLPPGWANGTWPNYYTRVTGTFSQVSPVRGSETERTPVAGPASMQTRGPTDARAHRSHKTSPIFRWTSNA